MNVTTKMTRLYFKLKKKLEVISPQDNEENLKPEVEQVFDQVNRSEESFLKYIYDSWVLYYENQCLNVIKELEAKGFDKDFIETAKKNLEDKQIEEWLNFKRDEKNK